MSDDRKAIIGIHGWWGAGKTWLAHSAPGPRLVLDMEGGSEDVQTHMLDWDFEHAALPEGVTEDTSVIVTITDASLVPQILSYLEAGEHPFNSVVLDSLTENQKQLKERVANPGKDWDLDATFDQQAWGRLLNHGELDVRRLRNLTRKNAKRRVNVVLVMGSDTEASPVVPLLQGAIRKSLAGFLDLFGYLYEATNNETGEDARILQIVKSNEAEAKCRLHNVKATYGKFIINPDVREILEVINGGSTAETSKS